MLSIRSFPQVSLHRKTLPKFLAETLVASLIGFRDGTSRLSVPRRVTLPGEFVLPSQEVALVDAELSDLTPRLGDPSNAIGAHWFVTALCKLA